MGVDAARTRAQLLDDQRAARIFAGAPPAVTNMHRFAYGADAPAAAAAAPQTAASLWHARTFDFLVPQYDLEASPLDAAAQARRAHLRAAFRAADGDVAGARDGDGDGASGGGTKTALLRADDALASPLHLVITPAALERYARVHRFLMRVRRVVFELHRLWTTLMGLKATFAQRRRGGDGGVPPPVFLLRHEAQHFITCLDGYLTSQVLEGCFEELLQDCGRQATSVSGLRAAHDAYTQRLAARCLVADPHTHALGQRTPTSAAAMAAKLLDTIFNVILDFCHLVQTHAAAVAPSASTTAPAAPPPPGGAPPPFPASLLHRVATCRRDFHKHVRFLFGGLAGMSAQGAGFAHIDDLLARLSVTDYYSRVQ
jgi:hypothetical protein